MAYSRDYPNSIIPKGSKVVECLQNDDKELKRILGILSDIGVMSLFGSKRQCVLHAATGTDGKPSYLTANGLNVAINGSTTPVIVTFAGGYNANGTVDKTDTIVDTVNAWTMPANGTYYLYIDKDMSTGILSYGYTTIPDTYATTAPKSPTLDQCYFNTVEMKMYHYNSSAWEQKLRVFVAKAVTTDSAATLTMYPFTSRATPSNLVQYDSDGNLQVVDNAGALAQLTASKFIGAVSGNSATASTLATPRTIALSGKATGTATSFDGSGNIAIPVTAVTADSCAGNSATATNVAWSGVTDKPSTYPPADHNHDGRYFSTLMNRTADLNGVYDQGNYYFDSNSGNRPCGFGQLVVLNNEREGSTDRWVQQIAYGTDNNVYKRQAINDGNWSGWTRLAYASEIPSDFPSKAGSGAYGTWGINISGNSDTVDGWHLQSILDRISASNTGGIVAQSLGTNGYAKWSTCLILQWGVATINSNGSATFPISFSSSCTVVGGRTQNGTGNYDNFMCKSHTLSSASFCCNNNTFTVEWIAFGY